MFISKFKLDLESQIFSGLRFFDPTVNHKEFCKREMNDLFTEYSETEGDESAETKKNVSFILMNIHLKCVYFNI